MYKYTTSMYVMYNYEYINYIKQDTSLATCIHRQYLSTQNISVHINMRDIPSYKYHPSTFSLVFLPAAPPRQLPHPLSLFVQSDSFSSSSITASTRERERVFYYYNDYDY